MKLIKINILFCCITFICLLTTTNSMAQGIFITGELKFPQGLVKNNRYYSPHGLLSVAIPNLENIKIIENAFTPGKNFSVGFTNNPYTPGYPGVEYDIDVIEHNLRAETLREKLPPPAMVYKVITQVINNVFNDTKQAKIKTMTCQFITVAKQKAYQCTIIGKVGRYYLKTVATSMVYINFNLSNKAMFVNVFGTETSAQQIPKFDYKRYNELLNSIIIDIKKG